MTRRKDVEDFAQVRSEGCYSTDPGVEDLGGDVRKDLPDA